MRDYVDPNKNAIALLNFPLIMIIIFALVVPKKNTYTHDDLIDQDSLLNALYYALPVPNTKFKKIVFKYLSQWIERQRGALIELIKIGVNELSWMPE